MISFISKIFGSKNKKYTSLVINDRYLEVAQLSGSVNQPTLISINRVALEDGIIKGGEIRQESVFQEILQKLFEEAMPNPIKQENLYINIPFEQIYPFVKSFSKHSSEELIQSGLDEFLKNKVPFNFNDLDRDYERKEDDKRIYSSVVAYPKRSRKIIKEVCNELGFKKLHFFTEPFAQMSISEFNQESNFALFSWLNEKSYLSVFYHGLLYDSYLLNSDDLMSEFKKEVQNFDDEFGEFINSIYFVGFPKLKYGDLKKEFDVDGLQITFLRDINLPISDIIPIEKYSFSLIGLVIKSFEL